jgi:undecaprenyl-diphosphatase
MPIISDFGNLIVWFFICAILFLFEGKKGKNVAILAILALILSSVAVGVLKYVVAEPRPFVTLENVKFLTDDALRYYTLFPSGHTSGSFAFAVVVGLKYKITVLSRHLKLVYLLLMYAVLVGFSRIYIGVH